MKVYYEYNLSPFCPVCLFVMMIERNTEDRNSDGLVKSVAHCVNEDCAQFNKRFVIPPLSAEIIPESETQ